MPAEAAERHPRLNPSDWTKQSPYCHSELVSESVPRYEQVSNIVQTLKWSCSTREKRHREKRGFRLLPLLARAVQGDKFLSLRVGFTMAEILLSLTIIGVVAAITLPSLTGNINERTWNTQRKALYARFSQAVALMPSLNGYGTLKDESSSGAGDAVDTTAETFITAGLAKVLKINNICDNEHLHDCGINSTITTLNGSKISIPLTVQELNSKMNRMTYISASYSAKDTKAAAFETANGESLIVYYRPACTSNLEVSAGVDFPLQPLICANFVYDLNGTRGPNTVGKDIGVMTALFATDSSIVAPFPHAQDAAASVPRKDVTGICENQDAEYRLPSRDELASIWLNQKFFGNLTKERYWSSTLSSSTKEGYYLLATEGLFGHYYDNTGNLAVRCIKR